MAETRRVAIVTGAAGGIGSAMVRGLLSAGIRVAGVDRDREPLARNSHSGVDFRAAGRNGGRVG
jgi:NAD(P)-dependent dehydrogenase (short-subunit alcohol dehydrogenase family)